MDRRPADGQTGDGHDKHDCGFVQKRDHLQDTQSETLPNRRPQKEKVKADTQKDTRCCRNDGDRHPTDGK